MQQRQRKQLQVVRRMCLLPRRTTAAKRQSRYYATYHTYHVHDLVLRDCCCVCALCCQHSCYFKDEVQRQALDKLNQKRKWYQQQLEAERMMARSMAKSRQAAAAARGNKPSGRPGAPT